MRTCAICSGPLRSPTVKVHNGRAHVLCAKPIVRCETCGAAMPRCGPPRRRNGQIACLTCVPEYRERPDQRLRPTRDQTRGPRSSSTPTKHLTRELLASHAAFLEPEDFAALADRPKTWGECCESTGPCAFVSCKHHLYLDINPVTGSIKINYPDLEPEELEHPCALRIAATGGVTLEEVGVRLNLTRERVRQVEVRALHKLAGEMGNA